MTVGNLDAAVDRARAGDESAFAAVFRYVQPRLLRYLTVLAGSAAEDIAADTWMSVVQNMDGFTSGGLGEFQAWVITIARRRWVDEVRRRTRRPEVPMADMPDAGADESQVLAFEAVEESGRAVALLHQLPQDQADAVALRVVFGFDVATAAKLLGRKPGTVRVLAHRGLRRLAELLDAPDVTQLPPGTMNE